MTRYNCRYCNYTTEKSSRPLKCPYCSKKDAMIEEEKADDLVSEA